MDTKSAYKLWFDEELGVLRFVVYRAFDADTARVFMDEILNYPEEQQRYLMASFGKDAQKVVDKETRQIIREKGKENKWRKIAIYGAKPGLKMLAKIVVTAAFGRGKETEFFLEEKEAVDWMKAEIEKDKAAKTG